MNNRRQVRENTFRVEFGGIPKKPTSEVIHFFVGRHLCITREELVKIQIGHIDDCAFVKVTEQSIAERIVRTHDNKHSYNVKGEKYPLRIRMVEAGVDVTIHDLTENITAEQISRHMSAFGEVLSVQEMVWSDKHHFPGSSSGKWLVKMILREHIKSYITIQGETTWVTYPKQRQTCRHCAEYMHIGISCVMNKKLLAQKVSVNERLKPNSYAGALRGFGKGPSAPIPDGSPDDTEKLDETRFPELPPVELDTPQLNDQSIGPVMPAASDNSSEDMQEANVTEQESFGQNLDERSQPDASGSTKDDSAEQLTELQFNQKLVGIHPEEAPRTKQRTQPTSSRNISRSPIRTVQEAMEVQTTAKSIIPSTSYEQQFSSFSSEGNVVSSKHGKATSAPVSTANFLSANYQSFAQEGLRSSSGSVVSKAGQLVLRARSAMARGEERNIMDSEGYIKVNRRGRSKTGKQNIIAKRR